MPRLWRTFAKVAHASKHLGRSIPAQLPLASPWMLNEPTSPRRGSSTCNTKKTPFAPPRQAASMSCWHSEACVMHDCMHMNSCQACTNGYLHVRSRRQATNEAAEIRLRPHASPLALTFAIRCLLMAKAHCPRIEARENNKTLSRRRFQHPMRAQQRCFCLFQI